MKERSLYTLNGEEFLIFGIRPVDNIESKPVWIWEHSRGHQMVNQSLMFVTKKEAFDDASRYVRILKEPSIKEIEAALEEAMCIAYLPN